MSYCRCTEGSDVYVYANSVVGGWSIHVAYDCGLSRDGEDFLAKTPTEAIKFLEGIVADGYEVPKRAFDRLSIDVVNWND